MIKLKDILTEGNKFDDVYKDYGFDLEKKSGGLTYWAHYGSDISGHKNSYIRGELSGWTDGKKAAVGDDRGRQSFSNPKKMAKWFEKKFKMKKESVNEAIEVNIDKLLQHPKIKKLMYRLNIKKEKSKMSALKILNYFAVNPHALAAFRKFALGESVNERKLSSRQKKAILIAIEMSGNMTGATEKIEKIKKGLSDDKKVKDALQLANESINEAYPWHKLDLSRKEESFFEEMEYKIERMHPGKKKHINSFIVSVIDVYSQPQNDMSDIMSKYGMDDILKHVKRKGLKLLKRAV